MVLAGSFTVFLGLTLILEAAPYALLLSHRSWRERIAFWLVANIYSYPFVFYFFPYLALPYLARELLAEVFAPACEVLVGLIILPKFGRKDAIAVVAANLFSWLVGKLFLQWVIVF